MLDRCLSFRTRRSPCSPRACAPPPPPLPNRSRVSSASASSFVAPHLRRRLVLLCLCHLRSGSSAAATAYSAASSIIRLRCHQWCGGRSRGAEGGTRRRAEQKRNTTAMWKRDTAAAAQKRDTTVARWKRNTAATRERNSRVPVYSSHSLHAKLHFCPSFYVLSEVLHQGQNWYLAVPNSTSRWIGQNLTDRILVPNGTGTDHKYAHSIMPTHMLAFTVKCFVKSKKCKNVMFLKKIGV